MADPFIVARLAPSQIEPAAELTALVNRAAGVGAVVSFVGLARSEGGSVERLTLHHHPTLTQQSLVDIATDACSKFAIGGAWVVHRCGAVQAGGPIIFAGAAARHRRDAFAAADYLMDRLKTDAVFWKKEDGPTGSRWVEPTMDDYDAHKRWSD
nr:molybdenum cofactor biosynthesis protein MoaE [uncultured Sphingomonas sp.]